jgi:hypothetical protein
MTQLHRLPAGLYSRRDDGECDPAADFHQVCTAQTGDGECDPAAQTSSRSLFVRETTESVTVHRKCGLIKWFINGEVTLLEFHEILTRHKAGRHLELMRVETGRRLQFMNQLQ